MSRARRAKSAAWHRRQEADVHVRAARAEGYRSRAAYKLIEINRRHALLRRGMTVIDLGAAPGGWSQVAKQQVGADGRVLAVDLLAMPALTGIEFIPGDFSEPSLQQRILERLGGRAAVIISDMAPNLSGIAARDQAAMQQLVLQVVAFCSSALKPGGDLLIKTFIGDGHDACRQALQAAFKQVKTIHAQASRKSSRECYLLARGRGRAGEESASGGAGSRAPAGAAGSARVARH